MVAAPVLAIFAASAGMAGFGKVVGVTTGNVFGASDAETALQL